MRKLSPTLKLTSLFLALSLAAGLISIMHIAAGGAENSIDHRVTNLSMTAFTVSWVTKDACEGYVEYGDTPSLGRLRYDDRGERTISDTHHVSIGDLVPDTLYYYDIISNGIRYDNGGAHYSVSTAPRLFPDHARVVFGQVYQQDGKTPKPGSIVYLQAIDGDGKGSPGRSQEWSRLTDQNGFWWMSFGTLTTRDLQSLFELDYAGGDNLLLVAEGAAPDKAFEIVPLRTTLVEIPPPAPTMVLGKTRRVDLQAGRNLIVIPIELSTSYTAEGLLQEINSQGGHAVQVERWNESLNAWDSHQVGSPYNDFEIQIGREYFVGCNTASTWTAGGTQ